MPWPAFPLWLALLLGISQSCSSALSQEVSNLSPDERVVFFTTDAMRSNDQLHWTVPIHAWVYELDRASIRRATVAATLRKRYGLKSTVDTKANFDQRIRLIVADNESGKRIIVKIAGKEFTLPETGPNGHVFSDIQLDAKLVSQHARGDRLSYSAITPPGDARSFSGTTNLIPQSGISVISDFDDTVKITQVTDRSKMLDHSLYRNFQGVPGMADRYSAWAEQGVTFHFVSSSPWQFYEPIELFLNTDQFPARSMSLKHFRFKDASLLNLFKKGIETKPAQIMPILNSFPQRKFILIGDSGEQDPEVYAGIFKQFPQRVLRIYIRNVTNEKRTDERFQRTFAGIDDAKWLLFDDPDELTLALEGV